MAIDVPVPRAEVRKLTLDDVIEMVDAGIIKDTERVELVDGVLVTMSPEGVSHAAVVTWLTRLLTTTYAAPFEVRVNTTWPLSGPHHFRVPDLLVTTQVGMRWPQPDEAVLAVEVAGTSTTRDLGPKAREYAQWGAPNYWVVDLPRRTVVVHSALANGRYGSVVDCVGDDLIRFPESDRTTTPDELMTVPGTEPPSSEQ